MLAALALAYTVQCDDLSNSGPSTTHAFHNVYTESLESQQLTVDF